jgi:hypothetical protein
MVGFLFFNLFNEPNVRRRGHDGRDGLLAARRALEQDADMVWLI